MEVTEAKPLQPLSSGIVLLVGVKASNFDDEIKNHPRIVMWDSQNAHWTNKDLPSNTRAVFMTRFIGHAAFGHIITEARKRHITIFNPSGTGIIARQVRELLALNKSVQSVPSVIEPAVKQTIVEPTVNKTVEQETTVVKLTMKGEKKNKLQVLVPFIDFNKTNIENARALIKIANERGIRTSVGSLAQFAMKMRRRQGTAVSQTVSQSVKSRQVTDVSIQMFDNLIKELQDMRQFFVSTVEENKTLKARIDGLKKALGE